MSTAPSPLAPGKKSRPTKRSVCTKKTSNARLRYRSRSHYVIYRVIGTLTASVKGASYPELRIRRGLSLPLLFSPEQELPAPTSELQADVSFVLSTTESGEVRWQVRCLSLTELPPSHASIYISADAVAFDQERQLMLLSLTRQKGQYAPVLSVRAHRKEIAYLAKLVAATGKAVPVVVNAHPWQHPDSGVWLIEAHHVIVVPQTAGKT